MTSLRETRCKPGAMQAACQLSGRCASGGSSAQGAPVKMRAHPPPRLEGEVPPPESIALHGCDAPLLPILPAVQQQESSATAPGDLAADGTMCTGNRIQFVNPT